MPADHEFLKAYFIDSQAEMRWRREVEYKLLASLIPLCPALVAGLFALSTVAAKLVTLAAACFLTIFVWILYLYVSRKVKAENAIYKEVGRTTVRIWEYFDLFAQGAYGSNSPILLASSRKYGAGLGYKLTLNVFLAICTATTFMLLGIAAFAMAESLNR